MHENLKNGANEEYIEGYPRKLVETWRSVVNFFTPEKPFHKLKKIVMQPYLVPSFERLKKMDGMEKMYGSLCRHFNLENLPKKEYKKLVKDIMWCYLSYGCTFLDYVEFEFDKKTPGERAKFITMLKSMDYFEAFDHLYSDEPDRDLLSDKKKSVSYFGDFYKRKIAVLSSPEDIPDCVSLLRELGEAVLKPEYGMQGTGVEILKYSELENPEKFFADKLAADDYLLEERIKQNEAISCIFPHSVNTVRCVTCCSKRGEVKILYTILRMGRGNNFVDNQSQGGIIAQVNPETGEIIGKLMCTDTDISEYHPDTGFRVIGYKIPRWDELVSQLTAQARLAAEKEFHLVGWDMSLSADNGWVMVEGNDSIGSLMQIILQKGMKDEFDALVRWVNE